MVNSSKIIVHTCDMVVVTHIGGLVVLIVPLNNWHCIAPKAIMAGGWIVLLNLLYTLTCQNSTCNSRLRIQLFISPNKKNSNHLQISSRIIPDQTDIEMFHPSNLSQ